MIALDVPVRPMIVTIQETISVVGAEVVGQTTAGTTTAEEEEVEWIVEIEVVIRWNVTGEEVQREAEVAIETIVSADETRIGMASGRRRRRTSLWDR